MMEVKKLKYVFIFLSALLLAFMLLMSRDAGVNCDEVLHYDHSVAVYNYFASHGEDKSALDTPVTNLKYYGQSFDNITTILIKLFGAEDIYGFRHFMSSLAGWLTILITALFAIWLSGYEAGILVIILFAVSPTFLGHSQNNLKDIPFALAYISGIYFTCRLLSSGKRISLWDIFFLTLSMAFCISIRAGGLILVCYLFFFFFAWYLVKFLREGRSVISEGAARFAWITGISVTAYLLSIILWPYALQDPLRNPWNSYKVMLHFPGTFRQIFEGTAEWSDFMPWYYLPKSMIITIPLIVTAGLILFAVFPGKIFRSIKSIWFVFLLITVILPVIVVIINRSNLYSSWRHFLFVYPGLIVISSVGIFTLFEKIKKKLPMIIIASILVFLSIHPLSFMVSAHRYAYLYYNQLIGGTRGANGNYETDYYFVSQREASEWLTGYLHQKGINDSVIVGSNFSVEWFFRHQPQVKNIYIRYEERSMKDWDYAIITNRYIPVYQLKYDIWPPKDALKVMYACGAPVSAIIERRSKASYLGSQAVEEKRITEALNYFSEAIKADSCDEMIFYNFAVALYRDGQKVAADSVLKRSLMLNAVFEPALMFLGNIAAEEGRRDDAKAFYEKLISVNRKYYEAYISLAKMVAGEDLMKARRLLRQCLVINPDYSPAIMALADTYAVTDPEIARKYYELLKTRE